MERLGSTLCFMSGERLLASYIVQLTVRGGERVIRVLDIEMGTTSELTRFQDLVTHLQAGEERVRTGKPAPPT